jgi:hypothetical protein
LPADVLEDLKKLSVDRGMTPSEVVRALVVDELARTGYKTDPGKEEDSVV